MKDDKNRNLPGLTGGIRGGDSQIPSLVDLRKRFIDNLVLNNKESRRETPAPATPPDQKRPR
jgi:hypothetical protein